MAALSENDPSGPAYTVRLRIAGRAGTSAYKAALLAAGAMPEIERPGALRDAVIDLVTVQKALQEEAKELKKDYERLKEVTMLERSRLVCIRHEVNLELLDVIAPINSPRRIIKETAGQHGLSAKVVYSSNRDLNVVRCRQEAWYLLRMRTSLSFPQIAMMFEGHAKEHLDHTTVISGVGAHKKRVKKREYNKKLKAKRLKEAAE